MRKEDAEEQLLSTYCIPSLDDRSVLFASSPTQLIRTQQCGYHPHFRGAKTKVQRGGQRAQGQKLFSNTTES